MPENIPIDGQVMTALARLCTALRFLTVLPISWRSAEDHHHFRASLPYFPLVGLLIGGLAFFLAKLLFLVLPSAVVVALLLTFLIALSGGLHLDGLADSADGLLSGRPRQDALRIMKDSRVGAMGVITVVAVLLTKYAALSSVSPEQLPLVLLLVPAFGRGALLLMMARLPYVGGEDGVGQLFYEGAWRRLFLPGWLLIALAGAVLAPGLVLTALAGLLGTVLLFSSWCRSRIGGTTGDTLGASCELAETVVAIGCTSLFF